MDHPTMKSRQPQTAECRCPLRETGECHCPTCGEHFSTPANFDRHRVTVDLAALAGPVAKCADPASRGLARNRQGVWVRPAGDRLSPRSL